MTIFSKPGLSQRSGQTAGFTLLESMMVVVLATTVVTLLVPSLVFFSRSMFGVGNYCVMSAASRSGLEIFSRDLHAAESITMADESGLIVTLPAELSSATVMYSYNYDDQELSRTITPLAGAVSRRVLFGDVDRFSFVYYNRLGVEVTDRPSVLIETKSVQINAKLIKQVVSVKNTDYIISARFLMRNI